MEQYNVIGIMSGTSLDGLDICYATYTFENQWTFQINKTYTSPFSEDLMAKLKNSINLSGFDLSMLNNELGIFIGKAVNDFINKNNIPKNRINFVSSHGHTVFHQPEKELTLQIGNGANISVITKLPVICDFRTTDLALGGNGAPLVPIGDQLLFSEYDSCINLGGIANISFINNDMRKAFDICPVNIVLNKLAQRLNLSYDKNGDVARTGQLLPELFSLLNQLDYYKKEHPKSLGIEWVSEFVSPLLKGETKDLLFTFVEHAAFQIGNYVNGKALLTGGGTFNTYLIERIKHYSAGEVIIPSSQIIDFKEALIFGFLGVLRLKNEHNILKSATGSSLNNIGGCIYNALSE